MNLVISTYTNQYGTGTASINAGSYSAKLQNSDIVTAGKPFYTTRGDGQEPDLAGVRLAGKTIGIRVKILSGSLGAGFDFFASLFDKHDTSTKTLTLLDSDDSSRSWYCTGRNLGIAPTTGGGNFICYMALDSEILYSTLTTTESTFAVSTNGQTQVFTISKGNISALPVIDVIPQASSGYGQRYFQFLSMYNYTNKAAPGYHIDITNGGWNTAALIKVLATNTASTMAGIIAGTPANGGTLTNLASTAAFPSVGVVMYDTEQISYTGKTATTLTGITRAVGGTTAASHANPTTVYLSKMLANGADISVLVASNGSTGLTSVPYWFGTTGVTAINGTGTKIWIQQDFAARALGYLSSAITNASTSLVLKTPEGNITVDNGLFLIDTEIIAYSGYDPSTYTCSNLSTRGAKGSTAASHSLGATVRSVNEAWVYYGDGSAATPLWLSEVGLKRASQQKKPIIDLDLSTNSSWVYGYFASSTQIGADEWKPGASGTGIAFAGDRDYRGANPGDPVDWIGVMAQDVGATAYWTVAIPFGLTSATFNNSDRINIPANTASVYAVAGNGVVARTYYAAQGNAWATTTFTLTPTYVSYTLFLYIKNATGIRYVNPAAIDCENVTIALSALTTDPLSGRPFVGLGTIGGEQTITYDAYFYLQNTTTGHILPVKFDNMAIGATLRIDTLNKTITYLTDGRRVNPLPFTARENWLELRQGANTLAFYYLNNADGTPNGTLNVIVKEQYRSNTFG